MSGSLPSSPAVCARKAGAGGDAALPSALGGPELRGPPSAAPAALVASLNANEHKHRGYRALSLHARLQGRQVGGAALHDRAAPPPPAPLRPVAPRPSSPSARWRGRATCVCARRCASRCVYTCVDLLSKGELPEGHTGQQGPEQPVACPQGAAVPAPWKEGSSQRQVPGPPPGPPMPPAAPRTSGSASSSDTQGESPRSQSGLCSGEHHVDRPQGEGVAPGLPWGVSVPRDLAHGALTGGWRAAPAWSCPGHRSPQLYPPPGQGVRGRGGTHVSTPSGCISGTRDAGSTDGGAVSWGLFFLFKGYF